MSEQIELKKSNELHSRAMDLVMSAKEAAAKKDQAAAKKQYTQALELEQEAAKLWNDHGGNEPWRSILYRSAAWLAIHAGKHKEAVRLAAIGLAGESPAPIDRELEEVMKEVLNVLHPTVTA